MRSRLRRALKAARAAADAGGGEGVANAPTLRDTVSLIDKLAQKGVIHANAAARHKSRLVRRMRRASSATA